jgi:hypothetical protein
MLKKCLDVGVKTAPLTPMGHHLTSNLKKRFFPPALPAQRKPTGHCDMGNSLICVFFSHFIFFKPEKNPSLLSPTTKKRLLQSFERCLAGEAKFPLP